ncbi:MAG: alpha-ketoglutarate-dependent dioxygenase AlkB [Gammaproteobacteria bacterium]|nr:alpha-ketoglutarate-dependent dioxygenase AlkB [Gammaproteobacteria bacterium]
MPPESPHWLIRPGLLLCYVPSWLGPQRAQETFETLLHTHQFSQGQIQLFGRWMDEPRAMDWCGDAPYTYAKKRLPPQPWSHCAAMLRHELQALLSALHCPLPDQALNHVLLNLYRDGQDSMGYHQDNERELGRYPLIVSLSLGASRRFLLRPHPASGCRAAPIRFTLSSGDVLIMAGRTQLDWQHQVPKTRQSVEPRLNLTFRTICEDFGV